MSDSWMSIIEYARYYKVSDMTVRRRIKTGRIQAELRDGKYYIPLDENGRTKHMSVEEAEFEIDLSPTFEEVKHLNEEPKEFSTSMMPAISNNDLSQILENFEIAMDQIRQREELLKANFESERKLFAAKLDFAQNFELAIDHIKQKEDILKSNLESERRYFNERINTMGMEVKNKENEIEHLKKEIEELEILVKLFEAKAPV
jgi:hypothetical protein